MKATRRSSKSPTDSGTRAVHVDVLVLQRVAQLVGEHDLVRRGQRAVLAHRVQLLAAGPLVVEAGHVVLEQARAQVPQRRARGQQVEGDQQARVGVGAAVRVLVVQHLLQVATAARRG